MYRALLDLGAHDSIDSFAGTALARITEMSGAEKGYLELFDPVDKTQEATAWRRSIGYSDTEVQGVQHAISKGIIAEAVASGESVMTASALVDERFRDRGSVRQHRIEAVLCVPIGAESVVGVLYLQNRRAPGPFNEEELTLAETFCRYLSVFADRLLVRRRLEGHQDSTRELRARLQLDHFVGRGKAVAEALSQVALVAPLDVSVLLSGPSGSGKTQLARVLHDNSPRRSQPFVELNCSAIPTSLLESELFGAASAARPGGERPLAGKVEAAEHGTLFIGEIGELPLEAQAKLLQLLQSRQYYPVGGSTARQANVRVIAATTMDLRDAAAQRRFREDLLYRLEVLPVTVPSLAERSEDIVDFLDFFAARCCQLHRLPRLRYSPGAVRAALVAEWPGNVRQLANCVEAAVIRASASGGRLIESEHLFPPSVSRSGVALESASGLTFQQATRQFQHRLLQQSLEETGWNVTQTAERLDIARSHVYNLIKAFGLARS